MKLILGGYGVMGRVVEGLALERGHEIVGIFSLQDSENSPYPVYKGPTKGRCHYRLLPP